MARASPPKMIPKTMALYVTVRDRPDQFDCRCSCDRARHHAPAQTGQTVHLACRSADSGTRRYLPNWTSAGCVVVGLRRIRNYGIVSYAVCYSSRRFIAPDTFGLRRKRPPDDDCRRVTHRETIRHPDRGPRSSP
ncbi:hypothetical protein EVAR_3842_1 [Eumeta japonica]|uniref:Uncharacterized protein n=1 Tax=Eumeta variegata TaxID=151549 RepID=A0A4C1SQN8_EUMVA|nr:hypothetical protein EVAR_3842_1 [Eumeta japonica]